MHETWVLMLLDTLLEICLRKIKIATYNDRYVDAKIPKDIIFQCILDSEGKLCFICVGLGTEILFVVSRIPRKNSVLYLLDSAQKFRSISDGLRAEILLDACCVSHKNSVEYLLDSIQKLCSGKPATCVAVVKCFFVCDGHGRLICGSARLWILTAGHLHFYPSIGRKFFPMDIGL
jgi:hypothetical protein